MTERLVTPSRITAWLDCAHYLTLQSRVDTGVMAEPKPVFGSFAQLLQKKGKLHEDQCLADYKAEGKVYEVPEKADGESFAGWVKRVGNPLSDGHKVIYQMPFIHDGVRGVADFLERVDLPDGGFSYEPVDAKLTRVDAKPGHVLQLCFYADAIKALTGVDPQHMHILLGSGKRQPLRVNEFRPYWHRLRGQLTAAIDAGPQAATAPEKCGHCDFCEFFADCDSELRKADSLVFIPGIRRAERDALDVAGIVKIEELSKLSGNVESIRQPRLTWLVRQAALQVQARLEERERPPHEFIEPGEDPNLGHGFERMPQPNDGDVFLDFEGHPFWRPNTGLFFLFGLIERNNSGTWEYKPMWSHDSVEEAASAEKLITHLTERRRLFPEMHVYHYNHTERSALETLASKHGVGEADLGRLVQAKVFVDLFDVARNSIQVGSESYGLKVLERLTDYQRSHVIDRGAGAVVNYENFMADHNQADLNAIARYNEDDVRATRALRDWLVAARPAGMPWREPPEEPSPIIADIEDQIAKFHAFDEGTPEHLLGDLLGYWTNEWWAYLMPKLAQCQQDTADLLDTRDAIAALDCLGPYARIGKRGKELKDPGMEFSFPPQQMDAIPDIDESDDKKKSVLYVDENGSWRTATVDRLDRDSGLLGLHWGEKQQESDFRPTAVLLHPWVHTEIKRRALADFGTRLLDNQAPNRVTEALLRGDSPKFRGDNGPANGVFTDTVADIVAWAPHLDNSYVAVQGPPGTGKTYRAAHIIHALVSARQRVGITAFSHRAIENVVAAVSEIFAERGDLEILRGVRVKETATREYAGFENVGGPKEASGRDFNVLAGSTWLFCNEKIREQPLDVLLIDEAGQLALADALAASTAAQNLILLGDPLQLPQVTQAAHSGGGGLSALDHILGDRVTLPDTEGVFISETWRMHPDICTFISNEIYEGKVHPHPNCKRQTTVAGTGLRWLRAQHSGNSTASTVEAQIIVETVEKLIGTPWTDFDGNERPLTPHDFMVLAPYNDQVRTLRTRLDNNPRTAGVPVGTVDKFQGGQAAVVLFSMATSSGDDMVRGADFLFSRNRLNVAISRARCLAYLVCTEELLNTRARTVDEMKLIATLNAFVEYAEAQEEIRSQG